MRRLPFEILQKKIYERLLEKIPEVLIAEHVAQSTAFPYIVLSNFVATPDEQDTKRNPITAVTATLSIYSNQPGYEQVNQLANRVLEALIPGLDLSEQGFKENVTRLSQATNDKTWDGTKVLSFIDMELYFQIWDKKVY